MAAPLSESLRRLQTHRVNATKIRLAVLEAFLASAHSLSQYDIEASLGQQFDRTSIYRALQLFERQGILHRVPHTESVAKYALCATHEACTEQAHQHHHLHFFCRVCDNTFCVEGAQLPQVGPPPNSSTVETVEVLLKGVCAACVGPAGSPS